MGGVSQSGMKKRRKEKLTIHPLYTSTQPEELLSNSFSTQSSVGKMGPTSLTRSGVMRCATRYAGMPQTRQVTVVYRVRSPEDDSGSGTGLLRLLRVTSVWALNREDQRPGGG